MLEKTKNVSNVFEWKVGSLFAGIGGIDLGFQQAGFSIAWANEIDPKACQTYSKNFNHRIICEDIKKIDVSQIENVDILTAGFPCQAFSVAGHRKGFQDERGSVFFDMMKIFEHLKPKILFLENVKNLISHDKGKTFKKMIQAIELFGYHVKHQIMNTCDYSNIPQNRERLYLLGFRDKSLFNAFEFPNKETSQLRVTDLINEQASQKYYYDKVSFYPILEEKIKNKDTCFQWRRKYVRENKSGLCPTLTANMGTGGHNVPLILDSQGIRKLTPRECARFQGFPDSFAFPEIAESYIYKQIGNSVSVPVIKSIAKNLLKGNGHINQKSGEHMLEKTKKLASRRFEVQDSWEDSWERDSLIKLKKEIDKTPRPPKYNYFAMGDHPKMVKE